jgi:hypothetical protein
MAFRPKQIIATAVGLGRRAVSLAKKPSGPPSTVGAAKPGESRGPKSGTAPTRR